MTRPHLAEMGASIREIYTGGEPFADHLGRQYQSKYYRVVLTAPPPLLVKKRCSTGSQSTIDWDFSVKKLSC
jgi:hypothetical protein